MGNYLEITATDNGQEWISISVLSDVSRVPVDDSSPFTILSTYSLISQNGQQNYTATKGTLAPEDTFMLQISQVINTLVSGSFSGKLVSVEGFTSLGLVSLTEGKFKVSIKPD